MGHRPFRSKRKSPPRLGRVPERSEGGWVVLQVQDENEGLSHLADTLVWVTFGSRELASPRHAPVLPFSRFRGVGCGVRGAGCGKVAA